MLSSPGSVSPAETKQKRTGFGACMCVHALASSDPKMHKHTRTHRDTEDTCTCTQTHMHEHVCTHDPRVYIYVCTRTSMFAHVHTSMHNNPYTCTHEQTHGCMYTHEYARAGTRPLSTQQKEHRFPSHPAHHGALPLLLFSEMMDEEPRGPGPGQRERP